MESYLSYFFSNNLTLITFPPRQQIFCSLRNLMKNQYLTFHVASFRHTEIEILIIKTTQPVTLHDFHVSAEPTKRISFSNLTLQPFPIKTISFTHNSQVSLKRVRVYGQKLQMFCPQNKIPRNDPLPGVLEKCRRTAEHFSTVHFFIPENSVGKKLRWNGSANTFRQV